MSKIFYYHGLDSTLSNEKRAILEEFGEVISPTFDYRNIIVEDVLTDVLDIQFNLDVDVLIGSSMGGLMAYMASELKDLPCLLFNPALYANSLGWNQEYIADETFYGAPRTQLAYIVLGEKDTVVNYLENRKYIDENVAGPKTLIVEAELEHSIPVDVFEYHVRSFMQTVHPAFMLI